MTLINLLGLFVLFMALFFFHQQQKKSYAIMQWQKLLHIPEHQRVFTSLYADSQGFLLSKNAREQHDALDYVYGEIEFLSFIALLSLAKPDEHTIFYDLGSGTGKAVLACAMVYPVQQSVGVEIFPALHQEACNQVNKLAHFPEYAAKANCIRLIAGDFLKVDLSDATLIFINSTALFNPTWEKLCQHLEKSTQLKMVITTSKPLCSKDFHVVKSTKITMSWGVVRAYIHERKIKNSTNSLENIE